MPPPLGTRCTMLVVRGGGRGRANLQQAPSLCRKHCARASLFIVRCGPKLSWCCAASMRSNLQQLQVTHQFVRFMIQLRPLGQRRVRHEVVEVRRAREEDAQCRLYAGSFTSRHRLMRSHTTHTPHHSTSHQCPSPCTPSSLAPSLHTCSTQHCSCPGTRRCSAAGPTKPHVPPPCTATGTPQDQCPTYQPPASPNMLFKLLPQVL